jgi:DNA repair exonuclease SbcCD ATPase subunit
VQLIVLNKLTVQNFLSVGETPLTITFNAGINGITGINYDKEDSKNGVGKSTVVDALHFAFFGSTIRELTKDQIINSVNQKNCVVTLEFFIQNSNTKTKYYITRSLQPTKCTIFKDDIDVTRSTLPKTNEFIQKIIRSTPKVFQNSVVMTINNTVPFMAQSKVDKRKFIESVLNLEVFSDMLLRARDELNDLKKDYEVTYTKKESVEKSYKQNKEQLDLFEENKNKRVIDIQDKIVEHTNNIDTFKKQIQIIPQDLETLIQEKIKKIENSIHNVQEIYNNHLEKISGIRTEKKICLQQIEELEKQGSACPTCQREYTTDHKKHKEDRRNELTAKFTDLTDKENNLQNDINNIKEQQTKTKDEFNEIKTKKEKVQEIKNSNKLYTSKIEYITEQITNFKNEQEKIKKETNTSLEKIVQDQEKEITVLQDTVNRLNKEISVLECVKFVVSEEGVKSYIVKKVLKVLNARLVHYLQALHTNCICQFNEYFEEKITDENNTEKSYFNFSGGERKRIDLACLFAFLDIRRMQGDIHFNTVFYDELLDSSLDDKGVELVLEILQERFDKYHENCYIITHRGSAITTRVNNFLFLVKKNGFTFLENNG